MSALKALMPASRRERLLILFLVFSLFIGAYIVLRIPPMKLDLEVMQEQLDDSRKAARETRPMRDSAKNVADMREKILTLQDTLVREQKTLAGFKQGFTELDAPDAIASMRADITILAQKHRLRMLNIHSSSVALDKLAGVSVAAGEQALARPQFDLQYSGRFFDITEFISDLKSLKHAVVVTKLALEASPSDVGTAGNTPLTASFTLAF